MQINFFGKTMKELNTQIGLAELEKNVTLVNLLNDIKLQFINETKDLATNNKFLLGMHNTEGKMELVEGEGFTVKEIENLVFLQPLEILDLSQIEALVDALSNSQDSFPGKQIVVIPYNIKMLTATLMSRFETESSN